MAATGYIPFLFLLFLTSSLRTQARLPNFFHKTARFNVATEDTQLFNIPKQEEEDSMTSASQNPNTDSGLYGYYDPDQKKSPKSTNYNYNADVYELYDEDPLKGSPIGTNYNTEEDDFQLYHDQGTGKKKPYTGANYYYGSISGEKLLPTYQAKQSVSDTPLFVENGRNFYHVNYDDADTSNGYNAGGGSRGGYGSSISTQVGRMKNQYNYGRNENVFEYTNSMERFQGEPRDGFTP